MGKNEDQAGLPQGLPKDHWCTCDSPNLREDSNEASYFWEDTSTYPWETPNQIMHPRSGDIWKQLQLPRKLCLPHLSPPLYPGSPPPSLGNPTPVWEALFLYQGSSSSSFKKPHLFAQKLCLLKPLPKPGHFRHWGSPRVRPSCGWMSLTVNLSSLRMPFSRPVPYWIANLVPLGLKELEALESKRWWNPRPEVREVSLGERRLPCEGMSREGCLKITWETKAQPPSFLHPCSALFSPVKAHSRADWRSSISWMEPRDWRSQCQRRQRSFVGAFPARFPHNTGPDCIKGKNINEEFDLRARGERLCEAVTHIHKFGERDKGGLARRGWGPPSPQSIQGPVFSVNSAKRDPVGRKIQLGSDPSWKHSITDFPK